MRDPESLPGWTLKHLKHDGILGWGVPHRQAAHFPTSAHKRRQEFTYGEEATPETPTWKGGKTQPIRQGGGYVLLCAPVDAAAQKKNYNGLFQGVLLTLMNQASKKKTGSKEGGGAHRIWPQKIFANVDLVNVNP